VTRPAHQAGPFIQLLEAAGFAAIPFPAITICDIDQADALKSRFNKLDNFDILIFISVNAVVYALHYLNPSQIPDTLRIAAIGKRTAQVLNDHGFNVDFLPDAGYNSESLLALNDFQTPLISQQSILIIRGEGGREYLADTLQSRGARVDYAEVYRRCCPVIDPSAVLALWNQDAIQIVTVTSNEALKNLYHIVGPEGRTHLCQTPIVVPSQRGVELAQQLGFSSSILQAASATDTDMLDTIKNWYQNKVHTG
jgi:uroporphyrinogen-III synthase